jgi:hypothetical protein
VWGEIVKDQIYRKQGDRHVLPAVLHAFDARTMETLWSSDKPGVELGERIEFTAPTVANGRVNVGTGTSPDRKSPAWLTVFGPK